MRKLKMAAVYFELEVEAETQVYAKTATVKFHGKNVQRHPGENGTGADNPIRVKISAKQAADLAKWFQELAIKLDARYKKR